MSKGWTRPADLRVQLQKRWDRGELLGGLVTGESPFPMRLTLKCPTSAEMAGQFDEVRAWIAELAAMPHCRVEWREFKHRIFGTNTVPDEVWIDSYDTAWALLGKRREVASFQALVATTRHAQPLLLDWLAKRPLRALELAGQWRELLAIVTWLQQHPRPGIYLRQVDIPGVHSKFIEAHRGVLAELLDIALPPAAIEASASGASQFARRYGFCDKPLRIRFRVLDPDHALLHGQFTPGQFTPGQFTPGQTLPGQIIQDITLDAASFAGLDPAVTRVFITENEVNFLAFPSLKDSLVIFGAGYGFEMLDKAAWLARCRIYYWGDIDTHGFAILDQLRSRFAQVESVLMDRATLLAFAPLWGEEAKQTLRDLPGLNLEERALYDDLRDNRIRGNLRLEQERIGFGWVESALAACD